MSDIDRRTYLKSIGSASLVGVVGVAGCLGGGGGDGTTESAPTITAGTAPGFPPFEIKEGDELTGFDIELLEAVVAETNYELSGWEEFEFSSLIPALDNGNIDVVAAAMTINDERDQTIDFTDPYYNADQAVLVREDGEFSPSQLTDLSGHPVGAQEGTTGEGVVQDDLIANGDLSESMYSGYGSYVLAVQDLVNGNIDAIVIDTPVANTFAANRPVRTAFTVETGERYGFGVRTDADDLTEALNEGLATVQDNGTYRDLTEEWFGQ